MIDEVWRNGRRGIEGESEVLSIEILTEVEGIGAGGRTMRLVYNSLFSKCKWQAIKNEGLGIRATDVDLGAME